MPQAVLVSATIAALITHIHTHTHTGFDQQKKEWPHRANAARTSRASNSALLATGYNCPKEGTASTIKHKKEQEGAGVVDTQTQTHI